MCVHMYLYVHVDVHTCAIKVGYATYTYYWRSFIGHSHFTLIEKVMWVEW